MQAQVEHVYAVRSGPDVEAEKRERLSLVACVCSAVMEEKL